MILRVVGLVMLPWVREWDGVTVVQLSKFVMVQLWMFCFSVSIGGEEAIVISVCSSGHLLVLERARSYWQARWGKMRARALLGLDRFERDARDLDACGRSG